MYTLIYLISVGQIRIKIPNQFSFCHQGMAVLLLYFPAEVGSDKPRFQVRPMIGIKHSKIWFRIFVRIQGVAMGAY
ncbi:hypothetical protein DO021_14555 [Desulfobacter hydrogenophilus]|uniref:Uncharacterized protein n=1 Tax=Desulfobacter hydrogenophilus TaxID=2291 RepID=A0A328FDW8_9BACT|nr:hypothetical protein DO021_14555 [Desulfobacter hydrogenophilus]